MSQIKMPHGSYPDLIGRRSAFCGNVNGPKSYATGGDPITTEPVGYYIDVLHGGLSVSGTYLTRAKTNQVMPRGTWKYIWIVVSSGLEVSATTDLSAETIIASGYGGLF